MTDKANDTRDPTMAFRYPTRKRRMVESVQAEDGDASLSQTLARIIDEYLRRRGFPLDEAA